MPREATEHRLELWAEPRKARIVIHGSKRLLRGSVRGHFKDF